MFEVKLTTPTVTFTVGFPVRVDITIANHSQQLLSLIDPRCEPEAARMTVRDSQHALLQPRDRWSKESMETAARPCGHGEGVAPSKSITLFLNIGRWFDLSRPGQYFVQVAPEVALFDHTRQTQTSNVLEVEIKNVQEPPNNDSLAVWIEMQKGRVSIGQEPLAILTMKNMIDHAVRIHEYMYRAHVDGKDGEAPTTLVQRSITHRLLPGEAELRSDEMSGPYTIWPDESLVRKFQLSYLYDLRAPGKYTVYGEVMDPVSHQWLRTKPVAFEIVEKPQP
jgi:hypothetical protein